MTGDDRFTWGLVLDVFDALERYGYHRHDNQHTGQAFGMIFELAYVYEGSREVSYRTYPQPAEPGPRAEPGPSGPDTGVVIRTEAEIRTVVAALGTAAAYKRDRAADCADCADRSCPTCQTWLRDAQALNQMATQMLHTAETSAATAQRPGPDREEPTGTQPTTATDREAGQ